MKHSAGLHPYGYKRPSMKSVCQRLKQYPRLFQSKPMSEVFLGSIENSSEVKNLRASWTKLGIKTRMPPFRKLYRVCMLVFVPVQSSQEECKDLHYCPNTNGDKSITEVKMMYLESLVSHIAG